MCNITGTYRAYNTSRLLLLLVLYSTLSFFLLLQIANMLRLSYLLPMLFLINSALAQCPWQKDVPDLQSACLCAYNLGHELSVQCDQVRKCAPIIHRCVEIGVCAFEFLSLFFRCVLLCFSLLFLYVFV